MDKGIDFPMIMSYKDTENPNFVTYYYFLNGHNDVVYFADSNFTEQRVESYEYNPWGVLLTSASKNNLLYTARDFDFEKKTLNYKEGFYKADLGFFVLKNEKMDLSYFEEKNFSIGQVKIIQGNLSLLFNIQKNSAFMVEAKNAYIFYLFIVKFFFK